MCLIDSLSLARSYRVSGQLDNAIPLLEVTLAASERILGTDHPNTLIYRNNLTGAVIAANRANEIAKR